MMPRRSVVMRLKPGESGPLTRAPPAGGRSTGSRPSIAAGSRPGLFRRGHHTAFRTIRVDGRRCCRFTAASTMPPLPGRAGIARHPAVHRETQDGPARTVRPRRRLGHQFVGEFLLGGYTHTYGNPTGVGGHLVFRPRGRGPAFR